MGFFPVTQASGSSFVQVIPYLSGFHCLTSIHFQLSLLLHGMDSRVISTLVQFPAECPNQRSPAVLRYRVTARWGVS